MNRRLFLGALFAISPAAGAAQPASRQPSATRTAAGADRFGERRDMGISTLAFKVASEDAQGGLFIVEQTSRAKGGPARHLHHDQDEWFYVVEGDFVIEVGKERMRLSPGDSVLAPRRVPHVWAFVGSGIGKLIVAFSPAGLMQPFFREVTKGGAMPPQDPALWRAHGMELIGPPLKV